MTTMLLMASQSIEQLREDNWKNAHRDGYQENDGINNKYVYTNYKKHDIQEATQAALLSIWRTTNMFGTVALLFVCLTRYLYLEESRVWLENKKAKIEIEDQQPMQVLIGVKTAQTDADQSNDQTNEEGKRWQNVALAPLEGSEHHHKEVKDKHFDSTSLDGNNQQLQRQEDATKTVRGESIHSTSQFGVEAVAPSFLNPNSGHSKRSIDSHSNGSIRKDDEGIQKFAGHEMSQEEQNPINSNMLETVQHPYSLSIEQNILSVPSTVSSLSAPSVLTHNAHRDEDYFYHFLPDSRPGKSNTCFLLWKHYWVRLMGVSLCWLLWDVAFYGNKLFQSTFLLAMIGKKYESYDSDDDITYSEKSSISNGNYGDGDTVQVLLDFSVCATLNAAVAFCGYLAAAVLVDQPRIGRRRLQQWGFFVTGTLFVMCGFLLDRLRASSSSSWFVISLYLGTSFFGQLGPNATTFLIPAEIFPTEIRTVCHGIAAASGKMGALLAALFFHYAKSDLDMFLISGYCSLIACALTFYTIPESLGLPLQEMDRKWNCIIQNKPYTGLANKAQHLSLFERKDLTFKNKGDLNINVQAPSIELF